MRCPVCCFSLLRTLYITFLVGGAARVYTGLFQGCVEREGGDQKGQGQNKIVLAVFGKFAHRPA